MRALLRQPSTPWITYDRASRASHVGIGDVLQARPSVIVPQSFDAAPASATAPAEPSSMAVAADLPDGTGETPVVTETARAAPRTLRLGSKLGVLAAGCAFLAAAFVLVAPRATPSPTAAAKPAAAVPAELPPPDLGAQMAAVPSPKAAPAAPVTGKITIRGRARRAPVFVDGQRLAGSGGRSVAVTCGSHMIGVGSKAKSSRFDVPCNGEIFITR